MPAEVIEALRRGGVVAITHETGAVLAAGAEVVTPTTIAYLLRHTSGILCSPLTGARADELRLPPMVPCSEAGRLAWTVTVDLAHGTTTGISAADRCATVRALGAPGTRPADLLRPGHVVPIRVADGGVVAHPGLSEAAVDLTRLAGLTPVAVTGQVIDAVPHGPPVVDVAAVVRHRQRHERLVHRLDAVEPVVSTAAGTFDVCVYESAVDGSRHHVVSTGVLLGAVDVPVGIHPTCLTGEVLGSLGCDCATRLHRGLHGVAIAGRGAVLLLHRDGRSPHAPLDDTELDLAAQVLRDLAPMSVRLDTEDPAAAAALAERGVAVVCGEGAGAGPASSAARPPIPL